MAFNLLNRGLTDIDDRQTVLMAPENLVGNQAAAALDETRVRHGAPPRRPRSCASAARPYVPGASLCVPVVPEAACSKSTPADRSSRIQANGPKRIALQTRFSAIRCVPSIYERHREWDIEPSFRDSKDLRFGMGMSALRIDDPQRRDRLLLLNAFAILLLMLLGAAGESLGMDVNCEPAPQSAASIPCFGKAVCSMTLSQTCRKPRCAR